MIRSLLLFLFLLQGCTDSGDSSSESTSSNFSGDTPYLWASFSTPKDIQISEDFNLNEVTNIEEMAQAWNNSVEGDKIFFAIDGTTSELSNSGNIEELLDGTLGIYKTVNWPSDLPESALAVTQIFGERKNAGKANEFVDIQHADILVNYDIHQFDTDDDGPNYDLRTVILHEMGHFLGLQHKSTSSNRNSSIMYPSISSSENKREPKAIDILDIREKYSLDDGGGIQELIAEKNISTIPIRIIIELHADGNCIHKIENKIHYRHQVKISKSK
jgi:hypothetical protein